MVPARPVRLTPEHRDSLENGCHINASGKGPTIFSDKKSKALRKEDTRRRPRPATNVSEPRTPQASGRMEVRSPPVARC